MFQIFSSILERLELTLPTIGSQRYIDFNYMLYSRLDVYKISTIKSDKKWNIITRGMAQNVTFYDSQNDVIYETISTQGEKN